MKVSTARIKSLQKLAYILQPTRHHMQYTVPRLYGAIHAHQLRRYQLPSLTLCQGSPDHYIHHPELILQRHEGDTAGGTWTLPTDDQTSNPGWLTMAPFLEITRAHKALSYELGAKQGKGVRA